MSEKVPLLDWQDLSESSEFGIEFAEKLDNFIKSYLDVFKKKLKDRSLPLIQRWEVYLIVRKYLPIDSTYWTIDTLEEIEKVSWFDDFYLDRGEILDLDENFVQEATKRFELVPEQTDKLREEILQYGYRGFKNDW